MTPANRSALMDPVQARLAEKAREQKAADLSRDAIRQRMEEAQRDENRRRVKALRKAFKGIYRPQDQIALAKAGIARVRRLQGEYEGA